MGKLLADGCGALGLFDDAGRLAAQLAQVIQLGATHLAAAHHLDRVDHRRHHGEHTLDAFAVGNLADGEALVEASAGAADADAFIGLHAAAVAFDHLDVDDQGIAGPELRDLLAGGQFVELLFFELLNEVHRNLHRRRAQPSAGCAQSCHLLRNWRPYKATERACHPSPAFFAAFWPDRAAQRSGRRACVSASASARLQAATRAWSPELRISGIGRPWNDCGRVYWGYSSRPSEKLSSAPDSCFPITPGRRRTQASIRAIAAISPPDST